MGSSAQVPVFAETTLPTRIAIAVPLNITASHLKGELERAHSNYFPELGEVTVDALMVKQESFFYHLPDSVALKHVFHGCGGSWFIHVKASSLNGFDKSCEPIKASPLNGSDKSCEPNHLSAEARDSSLEVHLSVNVDRTHANIKHKRKRKRRIWCKKAILCGLVATAFVSRRRKRWCMVKKFRIECKPKRHEQECFRLTEKCSSVPAGESCDQKHAFCPMVEWDSNLTDEIPSESSSAVSVSGIIEKYFSNLIDLSHLGSPPSSGIASKAAQIQLGGQLYHKTENTCSSMPNDMMPISLDKTPQRKFLDPLPTDPDSAALSNKLERCSVGRRVFMASNSLQVCQNKQKPIMSLCRSKEQKSLRQDSLSLIRSLVFELGDTMNE